MQATPRSANFGLYVHWPFCLSKCPYCDFNSHVTDHIDHGRWRRALVRELETLAPRIQATTLSSIFIGGGTPSLMCPDTVAAVIDAARRLWPAPAQPEITLEANPTSVEASRFLAFRDAGVNRISLGVQALDDAALRFLGRGHDAREAIAAIAIAHSVFDNVSFDLIYARPGQTVGDWERELGHALTLAGSHLSLYQLVIEPGTRFHTLHRRGAFTIPGEDEAGLLYETTQDRMAEAGMPAYEISNHARPGRECRHNLTYWQSRDYLGIGPGAHGRRTEAGGRCHALRTHRAPAIWLDRVEARGHAIVEEAPLAAADRFVEILMMGLRLTDGVSARRLREATGKSPDDLFDPAMLQDLGNAGYLIVDRKGIRATADGRQRLDSVLRALIQARQ